MAFEEFSIRRVGDEFDIKYRHAGSAKTYHHIGDRMTFAQFKSDALRFSGIHVTIGGLTGEEAELRWAELLEEAR